MATTPTKTQLSPHAVIGVVVCLLGVLFTLDNLSLIDASNFFHYWPLVPIGFGLLFLMQADEADEWGRGALWLAFGGIFLARSLGYLPFDPFALWPLLLVLVGVKLMWRARACDHEGRARRTDRRKRQQARWNERLGNGPETDADWGDATPGTGTQNAAAADPWAPFPPHGAETTPSAAEAASSPDPWSQYRSSFAPGGRPVEPPPIPPIPGAGGPSSGAGTAPGTGARGRGNWSSHHAVSRVTLFALMSGLTRRVQGLFRGGQLTAIMGGIELDLRGAHLEDVAVIDTLAFWGGIEIFVPEDWVVVNQGFALMGGFDDSTKSPLPGDRPHLVIKGLALMGGVEIKTKKKEYWWKGK